MKLKLPELNQRVGIVLRDGRMLSTRVEGADGADLLIAPPSDQGVTYLVTVGEEVAIEWTTERGLFRAVGTMAGRADAGVPLVRVRVDESSVIQRREYVRVECNVNIDVRAHGERYTASTLDLSGAGARLSIGGTQTLALEFSPGDKATLVVYLPDGEPIETMGEVVRLDGYGVYAFRFVGLDPKVQERIIRWVFEAHKREFAMLRRSA
jgi:c-di-GMP-binding flagellar brake protein YcgR